MTRSAHLAYHLDDAPAQRHTSPLRSTDTQQGPFTTDRRNPARPCLCRSRTPGKQEHPHTPNSIQTHPRKSRSCRPATPASSRHGSRARRPPGIRPSRSALTTSLAAASRPRPRRAETPDQVWPTRRRDGSGHLAPRRASPRLLPSLPRSRSPRRDQELAPRRHLPWGWPELRRGASSGGGETAGRRGRGWRC